MLKSEEAASSQNAWGEGEGAVVGGEGWGPSHIQSFASLAGWLFYVHCT